MLLCSCHLLGTKQTHTQTKLYNIYQEARTSTWKSTFCKTNLIKYINTNTRLVKANKTYCCHLQLSAPQWQVSSHSWENKTKPTNKQTNKPPPPRTVHSWQLNESSHSYKWSRICFMPKPASPALSLSFPFSLFFWIHHHGVSSKGEGMHSPPAHFFFFWFPFCNWK